MRKEDEEDPSGNGKRDGVEKGFRLQFGWRNAVPGKSNSHETPSPAPREDNGGHQEFSSSERRVPEKETNERNPPFFKRLVPPPYTRPKPGKDQTNSEALPGGSGGEEVDNKPEGITARTNSPGQEEVAENPNAQASEEEAKPRPRPRSVRTRQRKPLPGEDQDVESVKTNPRGSRLDDQRRGLQIFTAMDSSNQEEELDRLLIHYSTKKPPHEHRTAEENNEPSPAFKHHHPPIARSHSLEPTATAPSEETRKGHVRASSFQPEMLRPSHVHPKLPDYDEVTAYLAAYRRK